MSLTSTLGTLRRKAILVPALAATALAACGGGGPTGTKPCSETNTCPPPPPTGTMVVGTPTITPLSGATLYAGDSATVAVAPSAANGATGPDSIYVTGGNPAKVIGPSYAGKFLVQPGSNSLPIKVFGKNSAGTVISADGSAAYTGQTKLYTITLKVLNRADTLGTQGTVPATTYPINGQNYTTDAQGRIVAQVPATFSIGLGTVAGSDATIMHADRFRSMNGDFLENDGLGIRDTIFTEVNRKGSNGKDFSQTSITIDGDRTFEVHAIDGNYKQPASFSPSLHFGPYDAKIRGGVTPLTRNLKIVQYSGPAVGCTTMNPNTSILETNGADSVVAGTTGMYNWTRPAPTTVLDTTAVGTTYQCTSANDTNNSVEFAVNGGRTGALARIQSWSTLGSEGSFTRSTQISRVTHETFAIFYNGEPENCDVASVTIGAASNCNGNPNFVNPGLSTFDRTSMLYNSMFVEFNSRANKLFQQLGVKNAQNTTEQVYASINPANKNK